MRLSGGLQLAQPAPPALPLTGHTALGRFQALYPFLTGEVEARKPFHRAAVSVGDEAWKAEGGLVQMTCHTRSWRGRSVPKSSLQAPPRGPEPLAQNLKFRE